MKVAGKLRSNVVSSLGCRPVCVYTEHRGLEISNPASYSGGPSSNLDPESGYSDVFRDFL
jgi:hypothetical protein